MASGIPPQPEPDSLVELVRDLLLVSSISFTREVLSICNDQCALREYLISRVC
jgi:hypothetical protein